MTQQRAPLVRQGTKVDRMLATLSSEIVSGQWAPGTKLDAQAIASRFQVSRTPVREAFSHLAAMGLVLRRPNRGVVIANISDLELAHMFEAMAELEAACVRLAALRMTEGERQVLRQRHLESLSLVRGGHPDDYEIFNHGFHTLLFQGSHSPHLTELTLATRSRLQPFRRAQFQLESRLSKSWEEHDTIVKAILAGDSETAARAIRSHIHVVSVASTDFVRDHRP